MKNQKKNNTRLFVIAGSLGFLVCVVFGVAAWTAASNPAFASILSPTPPSVPEQLWAQVEIAKPLPRDRNLSMAPAEESAVPMEEAVLDPAVEAGEPAPVVVDEEPTFVPAEAASTIPEVVETPAQLSMEIVPEAEVNAYTPSNEPQQSYPATGNGERWIDVDLTNQRLYAYEGDVVVNSFIVSTGTWLTPTVTGRYKVYVKYVSNKMSGPGYYLPNVPYIMYFYGSYGLHGTYWHNNFGTPMSHGCVNLRTEDAQWLYNWASVGTVVNVHY